MSESRKLMFLMQHSPRQGWLARERLDQVLMALAFDCEVRLAFVGDGVWQLLEGQNAEPGKTGHFSAGFRSLELYGVAEVLVEDEALKQRGLEEDELLMPVRIIDRASLRLLISTQDQLL